MSLREWAVKPAELRALSRSGMMLFCARCAMRVEPWVPKSATKLFAQEVAFVVDAAFAAPFDKGALRKREIALGDLGVTAFNDLKDTDAALGRCMSYATQTLATALDAATTDDRKVALNVAISSAKLSASIPAVWAHAGRVHARDGRSAVDLACTSAWAAIRSDIAAVEARLPNVERAQDRVKALRAIARLWPGRAPAWAVPSRARKYGVVKAL
jgi:hypothetical protein